MIDAGEVDANAEHIIAIRRNVKPMYIEAFTQPPGFRLDKFISGDKHVIIGQKGTGKTAILRNIQADLSLKGWNTEYIIFRDTILEERELSTTPFSLVIDKQNFQSSTFYHHALKRLFISVMLRLASESVRPEDMEKPAGLLTDRAENLADIVRRTNLNEQVSVVAASLAYDASNVMVLLGGNQEPTNADIIRVFKSINDRLLTMLCNAISTSGKNIALFVDELHFSYAKELVLSDDAVLVRDAILALMSINDRMAREQLPAAIFSGVRSEYLTHPVIAQTELTTRLEAAGVRLGWETIPINKDHPLFTMATNRIATGLYQNGMRANNLIVIAESLVERLFTNGPPNEFLRQTWAKPRDLVRFLKIASTSFGSKTTLIRADFSSTMHQVAIESWGELKSALSSFLTTEGLTKFEDYLAQKASISLETESFCTYSMFQNDVSKCIGKDGQHHLSHIMKMLYMIGIFSTVRRKNNGELILHSFHRGQPNADVSGEISLHFLVAKAFS